MPSFQLHPGFAANSLRANPWNPTEFVVSSADNFGVSGSGKVYVVRSDDLGAPMMPVSMVATSDGAFDACFAEVGSPTVIVVACGDGIKVYDLNAMAPGFAPMLHFRDHSAEVSSVQWNQCRQESFLSASWDMSVRLWSPSRPETAVWVGMEHMKEVYEASWCPRDANTLLTASGDGSWKYWDVRTPKSAMTVNGHQGQMIMSVDWNKYDANIFATGSVDQTVKIWDTRRPQREVMTCPGHEGTVRRVRFSPHSRAQLVSSGYDFRVCMWDLDRAMQKQHPLVHRYEHHREFVSGLDWSMAQPGVVASAAWDSTVWSWQLGQPPMPTPNMQPLPMVDPPPRPPGASHLRKAMVAR